MVNADELRVGMKVKIVDEYDGNKYCVIPEPYEFYLGKVFTIKSIASGLDAVRLDIDEIGPWYWELATIDCIVDFNEDFEVADEDDLRQFLFSEVL